MNQLELLQLMTDSAKDAIAISKEEFDIDLDYSLNSIEQVDQLLNKFLSKYKDEILEDKSLFTLCNVYGAYIGETFRKHIGGNWLYDETKADTPFVFVVINDKSYAFAGVCYEKLINRTDTSVEEYFSKAAAYHSDD